MSHYKLLRRPTGVVLSRHCLLYPRLFQFRGKYNASLNVGRDFWCVGRLSSRCLAIRAFVGNSWVIFSKYGVGCATAPMVRDV